MVSLSSRRAAYQRMPGERGDCVTEAGEHSGLRAAEQLVAAECDEVGALSNGGANRSSGRTVEPATAEIVDQQDAVGAGEGGEFG